MIPIGAWCRQGGLGPIESSLAKSIDFLDPPATERFREAVESPGERYSRTAFFSVLDCVPLASKTALRSEY